MLQLQRLEMFFTLKTENYLFSNIAPNDLDILLSCCEAKTRSFEKGDFIWLSGAPAQHIGVVLFWSSEYYA